MVHRSIAPASAAGAEPMTMIDSVYAAAARTPNDLDDDMAMASCVRGRAWNRGWRRPLEPMGRPGQTRLGDR